MGECYNHECYFAPWLREKRRADRAEGELQSEQWRRQKYENDAAALENQCDAVRSDNYRLRVTIYTARNIVGQWLTDGDGDDTDKADLYDCLADALNQHTDVEPSRTDAHPFEMVDIPEAIDPNTCWRCGEGRFHPSHLDPREALDPDEELNESQHTEPQCYQWGSCCTHFHDGMEICCECEAEYCDMVCTVTCLDKCRAIYGDKEE